MELYLLSALIFIYMIVAIIGDKALVQRLWTLALILSFGATALTLALLRISKQDVMVSADQFNWYNILYVCCTLSVAIGIINLWMYRREVIKMFISPRREIPADSKE